MKATLRVHIDAQGHEPGRSSMTYDLEKEVDVPYFYALVDRIAGIDAKIRDIFDVQETKE